MKAISHESDYGFQKVAIIMAVLTVLFVILSVAGGSGNIPLVQNSDGAFVLAGFVTINLIFSYTKGFMRYYLGTNWVEIMYTAFLATGLFGMITILANVLFTLYYFF